MTIRISSRAALLLAAATLTAGGCEQMQSTRESMGRRWDSTKQAWQEAGKDTYARDARTAYSNSGQGGGFSSYWQQKDAHMGAMDSREYESRGSTASSTNRDGWRISQDSRRDDNSNTSMNANDADVRILNFVHSKNLEEVQLGRLAQSKGTTEDVREFGRVLVKDHSQNDERLMALASDLRITLSDSMWQGDTQWQNSDPSNRQSGNTQWQNNDGRWQSTPPRGNDATSSPNQPGMSQNASDAGRNTDESGSSDSNDNTRQNSTDTRTDRGMNSVDNNTTGRSQDRQDSTGRVRSNQQPTDMYTMLQNTSSTEFDGMFARHMLDGHRTVIDRVESAARQTQNGRVRSFLESTLSGLRDHERRASRIVGRNTQGTEPFRQDGATRDDPDRGNRR